MTWFMFIMLVGLLAVTPFVLRFIVFSIIYPLQARSMKGAWTKDPRFYAYSEYYDQQQHNNNGGSTTTSRVGRHGRHHGGKSRGGGGGSRGGGRMSMKAVDSDVPDLIPMDA